MSIIPARVITEKARLYRRLNHAFSRAILLATLLPTVTLYISPATFASSQNSEAEEVRVTARRIEEDVQQVPIAIAVFDQEKLNQRNIVSGADLANYTPSLSVNTRFGADQASFAIRGFTQKLRTTPSVAVYFADVVTPRGGTTITSGDGAGPGVFFDLQNVQVLKGPQGTLFGRNTTGGAIQIVPQEPTNKLQGYLDLSRGNYNMRRIQGVINVPMSDIVLTRFGIDAQRRDGYIKNTSEIGPARLSNTDYISGRASLILHLSNAAQSYTIFSFNRSENNGTIEGLFACNLLARSAARCNATLADQGDDFYAVENSTPNPASKLKQWQLINTTSWNVNEDFALKNILSYADLEQTMRTSVFSTNFKYQNASGNSFPITVFPSWQWPGIPSTSQTTFVEELRFQGSSIDNKLSWQAGIYYENTRPDGISGTLSPTLLACTETLGNDPNDWACIDPLNIGSVQSNLGKTEYINKAVYSQATYAISTELKLTTGIRYTMDETKADSRQTLYSDFPSGVAGAPAGAPKQTECVIGTASPLDCKDSSRQRSEAPTWVVDVDYLPTPNVMHYAKFTRGYRQGSVNLFGPEGIKTFEPEKVNAYEIGTKMRLHGSVPGTFNMALFYNKLSNQQLQADYTPRDFGTVTVGVLNSGSSIIEGAEIETTLQLRDDLSFDLAYTYLHTYFNQLTQPALNPNSHIIYRQPAALAKEGDALTFSPRHSVTMNMNYRLPLPAEFGDISVGAIYTYVAEQISARSKAYGTLAKRNLLNLNMDWKTIAGSPFDAALFMTNATNEKITTYVPGTYETLNAEFRVVGEPRMYGARVRYNFR
jgi:iron complex outermembrane recepter protein